VSIEGSPRMDDLATGMADGTITRGKAIKLAGAALLGGGLSLFAAVDGAEARHRRCPHNAVRCVVRRRGRRRVFCCPRALVQITTCRTAILGDVCIRIA
jgi:hypothetical protein